MRVEFGRAGQDPSAGMSWQAVCVRMHAPYNLRTSHDAQRVSTEGELL